MQKIVCPHCGLINLDKFVTYPHCAGCGTRLPDAAPVQNVAFWRLRLGAPVWATIIGVCCLSLAVIGISIARETTLIADRTLVVYRQFPRETQVQMPTIIQLTLDSTDAEVSSQPFQNVRLRLPRDMLKEVEVMAVSPPPNNVVAMGAGQYFRFNYLERQQPIRLLIRPHKMGQQRFSIGITLYGFAPYEFRGSFFVNSSPSKRPTKSHISKEKTHGR